MSTKVTRSEAQTGIPLHANRARLRRSQNVLRLGVLWVALAFGALELAQAKVNISNCTVTQPPTMVFVTDLLGNLTSATSFSVSCTTNGAGGSASFTVGLSAGSGTVAQRTQKKGSTVLTYNLYQDAAAPECVFPINNAEVRFAFAEDQEQVDKLLEVREQCPQLCRVLEAAAAEHAACGVNGRGARVAGGDGDGQLCVALRAGTLGAPFGFYHVESPNSF